MYDVPKEYRAAIRSPTRNDRMAGKLILTMGQASLQLRTALSSAAFYDAALQIDYEIQLADGSWYTLPVGRYTVAEAERSAAVVSLTGYDNMLKLESKFSGSAILGDAYTPRSCASSTAATGSPPGATAWGPLPNYWPGLPPSTGWAGCGSCSLERRPA